jgi:hypothetical protein
MPVSAPATLYRGHRWRACTQSSGAACESELGTGAPLRGRCVGARKRASVISLAVVFVCSSEWIRLSRLTAGDYGPRRTRRAARLLASRCPQLRLARGDPVRCKQLTALHMSPYGTELPIPNVRSSVANGGKADKICSMRVLRILTRFGHRLSLSNSLCRQPREHAQTPPGSHARRFCARQRGRGDLPSEPSTSLALAEQARYCDHDPGDKRREAREQ